MRPSLRTGLSPVIFASLLTLTACGGGGGGGNDTPPSNDDTNNGNNNGGNNNGGNTTGDCATTFTSTTVTTEGNNAYIFDMGEDGICPSDTRNIAASGGFVKKTVPLSGADLSGDIKLSLNEERGELYFAFSMTNLSANDLCDIGLNNVTFKDSEGNDLAVFDPSRIHADRPMLSASTNTNQVEPTCIKAGGTALYFGHELSMGIEVFDLAYIDKLASVVLESTFSGSHNFLPGPAMPPMSAQSFTWESSGTQSAAFNNGTGEEIYFGYGNEGYIGYFDNDGYLVGYAEMDFDGQCPQGVSSEGAFSLIPGVGLRDTAHSARVIIGGYSTTAESCN